MRTLERRQEGVTWGGVEGKRGREPSRNEKRKDRNVMVESKIQLKKKIEVRKVLLKRRRKCRTVGERPEKAVKIKDSGKGP